MKLWVDDIRNAPDESWTVARTVTSAIRILSMFPIEAISLDHDISHQISLGKNSRPYACDETFMPVAHYLGLKYGSRKTPEPNISIHSANIVAGDEMLALLHDYGLDNVQLKPMGAANRLEMEV